MRKDKLLFVQKSIAFLIVSVGAIVMLVPFAWMISTSLKEIGEVFIFPPKLLGNKILWSNYLKISDRFPFWRMMSNTVFVAGMVLLGQLVTSSMAGFAFTYFNFKGKNTIFLFYLLSIMIPFHVLLVPTFALLREMHLLDTLNALILPVLVTPFGAFLMRQSFLSIPRDLGEAAKIDGCNPFGIFMRIYLPLSKPALTTLGIFTFVGTWNDFLRPLIFISSNTKMTLTLGIYTMQGMFATDWPILMAVTVMSLMPVIILFLLVQDIFIEGVALTGLKM